MSIQKPNSTPTAPNTVEGALKTAAKLTTAALLVLLISGCTQEALHKTMSWENHKPLPSKTDGGSTDGENIDSVEADSKKTE